MLRACMPIPGTTRHTLRPHPASPSTAAIGITAAVAVKRGRLELLYELEADLASLRIPAPAPARRTDELWRHTCFEAFLAPPSKTQYLEYNFSPSGAWAAYRFEDYRQGMAPLEWGAPPAVDARIASGRLELRAALDLGWLDLVWPQGLGALRLGLTAVIEDAAGGLSYWALAHGSEKPDFHRAGSFVAALT
jgi:hypothetical protein